MAIRRWGSLLTLLIGAAVPLSAHDIITTNLTFSRDISRIFAVRCIACHGAKDSIPLTSYQEARPWAVSIKEQVLSRAMPPWGAVKGFGDLSPDYGLTQEEITIIAAWVVGGAPEGDPAVLDKAITAASHRASTVPLRDALQVQTTATLREPVVAVGIKPMEDRTIASAKVIARLPDGEIVPLVWLYQFDGTSKRSFTFRSPMELPPGTVLQSSSPLHFAVETLPAQSVSSNNQFKVTRRGQ